MLHGAFGAPLHACFFLSLHADHKNTSTTPLICCVNDIFLFKRNIFSVYSRLLSLSISVYLCEEQERETGPTNRNIAI